MYLLLHVRLLSELSDNSAPRPLVAWVALFSSIVARGVFVASAIVLPAAVLTFAVIRAFLLQLRAFDVTFQIGGAVAVYTQGVLLFVAMRTIWVKETAVKASPQPAD